MVSEPFSRFPLNRNTMLEKGLADPSSRLDFVLVNSSSTIIFVSKGSQRRFYSLFHYHSFLVKGSPKNTIVGEGLVNPSSRSMLTTAWSKKGHLMKNLT